jgi:hypothetical protein
MKIALKSTDFAITERDCIACITMNSSNYLRSPLLNTSPARRGALKAVYFLKIKSEYVAATNLISSVLLGVVLQQSAQIKAK